MRDRITFASVGNRTGFGTAVLYLIIPSIQRFTEVECRRGDIMNAKGIF